HVERGRMKGRGSRFFTEIAPGFEHRHRHAAAHEIRGRREADRTRAGNQYSFFDGHDGADVVTGACPVPSELGRAPAAIEGRMFLSANRFSLCRKMRQSGSFILRGSHPVKRVQVALVYLRVLAPQDDGSRNDAVGNHWIGWMPALVMM